MNGAKRQTATVGVCVVLSLILASSPVKGGPEALYPYGLDAGDTSVGDIGPQETSVPLPIPMKYYGQVFKTAYILKDGMVSLEPGVQYLGVEWREGTPNLAVDRPFIAPFHHKGFVAVQNPQLYLGRIYYKLMSRARQDLSLTEEDRQFMLRLDDYLADASVVLKSGFTSDFVLKVTWENVSSDMACEESQLTTPGCKSNTFQVVIAANTEHTFAIFNYYKMEIPFTEHQLAGLNGGHGRGWTDVIPCTGACAKRSKGDKDRIMSLVSRFGSDVAGRYILVVDNDVIVRGGCLQEGLKIAELEVYPRHAGMFGGEMLSVSGVCNDPGTKIYCRFGGNSQARSEGVMETKMRGRCPVPILTTRGEVLMEMSTDNISWKTGTVITVIHPGRLPSPLDLQGIINNWFEIKSDDLKLRWKAELFSSNLAATLDVNLIGYREDSYGNTPLIMKTLEQLATGVLNQDEQLTVDPARFPCSGSDCQDFEIGLVQLRVAESFVDQTTKYQSVTLGPVPLGWYVKAAMKGLHGEDWPAAKCRAWNQRDRQSVAWLQHLLPCPCTLEQALADWGRWQPDMGCNMFTGSTCTYHVGSKHCVRSVHPSPDASGNQCCYDPDGNLRYAADTYQGSTPDRSHDWGAAPFGAPDHVPSLSHWLHDVITFYYCCLWRTESGDCDYYMERRATRDCVAYEPPHAAAVYGDPHVTTFDGKSYHFGGSGDFWLLKSDQLNIQGRFEQRENKYLQISSQTQLAPTNLTSLVIWTPQSDVITISLAPPGGPANRKLDVKVGRHRRFFEESSQMWQDFKDVSIVNNVISAANDDDKLHSNFTVLFVGGAAVQVAERLMLLHVKVILPPKYGQTEGLLGTLDGDPSNDFKAPGGSVIPSDALEDVVFLDFSLRWGVSSDESKFHWPKNVNQRTPLFGDPETFAYRQDSANMKPNESEVRQVCGDSQTCRRDYYVSADANVARASRRTEESVRALKQSQKIVPTCGLLDIPKAEKVPQKYTLGTKVHVPRCRFNEPAQAEGPRVFFCNMTASSPAKPVWTPVPNRNLCPHHEDAVSEAERAEKATDVGMIVGIVVGVVVVIAIVIIVIVIVLRGRRGEASVEERPVPAKRTNVPADAAVEPGTEESLLKHKKKDRDAVKMSEVITEMREGRGSSEAV